MSIDKLADRVKQLIDVTEQLLAYTKKLEDLFNEHRPTGGIQYNEYAVSEIPSMLKFLHCTFFFDALLNVNTLLAKVEENPDKKEQSFYELAELLSDHNKKREIITNLNNLRGKLEGHKLHKWRHKLDAHKDLANAGDTTIMHMNFVKPEKINVCKEIITKLNELVINYFDVTSNNLFEQLYKNGFEKMCEVFEEKISKK